MIETSHHLELQWICVYLLCYVRLSSICTFSTMLKCICQFHCLRWFFVWNLNRITFEPLNSCGCNTHTHSPETIIRYTHFTNLSLKMRNYHIHNRMRKNVQKWTTMTTTTISNSIETNVNIHYDCISQTNSCSEHRTSTSVCECVSVWRSCRYVNVIRNITILNPMSLTPGELVDCVCVLESFICWKVSAVISKCLSIIYTQTRIKFSTVGSILILEFKFDKIYWLVKIVRIVFWLNQVNIEELNKSDHFTKFVYISIKFARLNCRFLFVRIK